MEYSWNWITDRIALGGQFENLADVDALKLAGVTAVINCREVPDPDWVKKSFASYFQPLPAQPDDGKPRTLEWFQSGVGFWLPRALDLDQRVYVHCHAGLNRSASMVDALLLYLGLEPDDARWLIIRHRWIDAVGIRYAMEAEDAVKAMRKA
jgi:hypothetical protein